MDSILTHPPKPNKTYPTIYVDYCWQEQILPAQEIPLPPAPKKGYRETLVEGKWIFVRRDLNSTN
jgi:hypothetical protein